MDRQRSAFSNEDEGSPVTTITGAVPDQAALHGILSKIGNLNLPLLCVICEDVNGK